MLTVTQYTSLSTSFPLFELFHNNNMGTVMQLSFQARPCEETEHRLNSVGTWALELLTILLHWFREKVALSPV
jgi:hypothetical protein